MLLGLIGMVAIAAGAVDRCEAAPRRTEPFVPSIADSGRMFRGSLSRDGRTLYYFKKVTPGAEDYRIFVTRLVNGSWTAPERITLGGEYSELYPSIAPNGKRIVFSTYRPIPGDTSAHPNAHLWYVDREGDRWGKPVFMAEATRLGHYHSGPTIDADGTVRFGRTTPDFRTQTSMITRWKNGGYQPAEPDTTVQRWRQSFGPDIRVWGGRLAPDGRSALIEVARRDPLTGGPGPSELWASLLRGGEWSPPRPLGAGVNTSVTENFAFFSVDGCRLLFTRNFSSLHQVSWTAALADSSQPLASTVAPRSTYPVTGAYRGAFIRDGAVQLLDATITSARDTLRISMTTPDRLGAAPPAIVTRNGNLLTFRSWYGPLEAKIDTTFGEISGRAVDGGAITTLHLKKAPIPPDAAIERRDVSFASSAGATIAGTIVKPIGVPIRAAIVFVAGRGCVPRTGGQRLLEVLAPYGVAGIAIDKRGVGRSTGNCPFATIGQFSDDALGALAQIRSAIDAKIPVGFLGVSAGGWVALHASGRLDEPIDFLITNVGPATSVRGQQLDNAREIAKRIKLIGEQLTRAERYVELMFAKGATQARYDEMLATVEWAKGVGFADQFFDTSDIPTSVGGLDSLWVQLNDYDPAADYRKLRIPILAFYGGADEIVPADHNLTTLRRLTDEAGNTRVRAVVIPDADHSLFQPEGPIRDSGEANWRFERLSPLYLEEIVRFIRRL